MTNIKCPECKGEGEVAVCSECGGMAAFYMIGEDLEANCPECDKKFGFHIRKYEIIRECCMMCDGKKWIDVEDDFAEGVGFSED